MSSQFFWGLQVGVFVIPIVKAVVAIAMLHITQADRKIQSQAQPLSEHVSQG
jgi:hypothetical protein